MRRQAERGDRWANMHLSGDRNPPLAGDQPVRARRAPSDPRPVLRILERIFG
jgi:hypothetical protein